MYEKIIERIRTADIVGIFTHVNPDGDALGSAYSLKEVLMLIGKKAEVFTCGAIESKVDALIRKGVKAEMNPEDCDLLVALDSADSERLGKWSEVFLSHNNTVAVDHHKTHLPYAAEYVVCDISSTCEMMYGLYREMNVDIPFAAATNLYIGIVTDTGNFKYSSVTADTHIAAAHLIEKGIDFADIAKKLFDTVSKEYLMLKARATEKLRFYNNGRTSLLLLNEDDFAEFDIDEADASSLVVFPGKIEGVETGVYIRQRNMDEYKVSLRSNNKVDVSEIARKFGGGGHMRAAGYSVSATELEASITELLNEIEKHLD